MTPPTGPARATIISRIAVLRFANGFHGIPSCGCKGMREIGFFHEQASSLR
jgi:hypothetical protein